MNQTSENGVVEPAKSRWPRVFAALLAVFLVVEMTSQAGIYLYTGKRFDSLQLYNWSPYGLVRNNPQLTSPGFHINTSGFRELGEFSKQKPKDTYRVMLLGGSVLYAGLAPNRLKGYGRVKSDETISQYLQTELAKMPVFQGRKVEVINAAVNFNRIVEVSSGYLEEYIKWDSDLIVVFGSVNNFRDTRYKGDFSANITPLQMDHPWRLEFDRLNNEFGLSSTLERLWRGIAENSASFAVANKVFVKAADRLVSFSNQFSLANASERAQREVETEAEKNAYHDLYLAYAEAMIAAANQVGQKIVFAWEPLLGDLKGVKPLSDEEKTIYPGAARTVEQTTQYENTRKFLSEHFSGDRVGFFDPTEAMKSYSGTVFIDYAHYTPAGNSFIAKQLAKYLAANLLTQ